MKTTTLTMKNLVCFDNGGDSFDRFTILNKKTGDMIGASEHPYNPMGFGQYCGNIVDNYMNVAFGSSWRKHCDVKKCIKSEVLRFLSDCSHIGKKIKFSELPKEVQKFANYYFID